MVFAAALDRLPAETELDFLFAIPDDLVFETALVLDLDLVERDALADLPDLAVDVERPFPRGIS